MHGVRLMTRCTGLVATLLMLLVSVIPSMADPSQTTRYLMHEPVSMLTFGLSQLNFELENIKKSIAFIINGDKRNKTNPDIFHIFASYDFDSDKISINANCLNCGIVTIELASENWTGR